MLTENHIKAARGWLGWSQRNLAEHAGLSFASVQRQEERPDPKSKAAQKIIAAFAKENIEITEEGIRVRKKIIHVTDDFLEVLTEAQACLSPGDELLQHCASEMRNTPEVTLKLAEIVNSGIRMRITLCEGDNYMSTDRNNYRWIDAALFANSQVSIVYKDRYVFHVIDKNREVFVTVINKDLADTMTTQFNYFWSRGKKPWGDEEKKL